MFVGVGVGNQPATKAILKQLVHCEVRTNFGNLLSGMHCLIVYAQSV